MLRQVQQSELTDQLREALASRSVIDQAIGVVMNTERCDADRALDSDEIRSDAAALSSAMVTMEASSTTIS